MSNTCSLSFLTTLFLIFLVLKLTGHVAWSWWWVTAPLWAGWALVGLFAGAWLLVRRLGW